MEASQRGVQSEAHKWNKQRGVVLLDGNVILKGVVSLNKQAFAMFLFTQLTSPLLPPALHFPLPPKKKEKPKTKRNRRNSWLSHFSNVILLLSWAAGRGGFKVCPQDNSMITALLLNYVSPPQPTLPARVCLGASQGHSQLPVCCNRLRGDTVHKRWLPTEPREDIGYKLLLGRSWLESRRKLFTMRTGIDWNSLPRQVVDSPAPGSFQIQLDRVPVHLI